MSNVAFVDIETTGLDPEVNQVMEVAILTEPFGDVIHFSVPINPTLATDQALYINKYYERRNELLEIQETREDAATIIHDTLRGHVFVGNNPAFDAAFLTKLLKTFGLAPSWHYHVADIKAIVAGAYGAEPPWTTEWVSQVTGVKIGDDAHTAVADATWVRDVYFSLGLEEPEAT